jgi:hypothetical protein
MERMPTTQHELERQVIKLDYLGLLSDFGLSTKGGIKTSITRAEAIEAMSALDQILRTIEDFNHYSCIDDRLCIGNADNTSHMVRAGQAGGSLAPAITAILAGSKDFVDLSVDDINDQIWKTSENIGNILNVFPSSHTGGCGACVKLPNSSAWIAEGRVSSAVNQFSDFLKAKTNFEVMQFNSDSTDEIVNNAQLLLPKLSGWNPQGFTEQVTQDEPYGVEELNADLSHPYHGHESDVLIILNKPGLSIPRNLIKELGLRGGFVWNIDESVRIANVVAGYQGNHAVDKALMANIAYHFATAGILNEDQHIFYVE